MMRDETDIVKADNEERREMQRRKTRQTTTKNEADNAVVDNNKGRGRQRQGARQTTTKDEADMAEVDNGFRAAIYYHVVSPKAAELRTHDRRDPGNISVCTESLHVLFDLRKRNRLPTVISVFRGEYIWIYSDCKYVSAHKRRNTILW